MAFRLFCLISALIALFMGCSPQQPDTTRVAGVTRTDVIGVYKAISPNGIDAAEPTPEEQKQFQRIADELKRNHAKKGAKDF